MMSRLAPLAGRIPWTLVLFLAAFAIPWFGSRYETFLATQIAINALFAVSLNLLLGTTGLVSFGHVAYFGLGSYVCGILMKTYEAPFVLALSISSGATPASSRTRTQSFSSGIRMRLTMKPGVSLQRTGSLPARSAQA